VIDSLVADSLRRALFVSDSVLAAVVLQRDSLAAQVGELSAALSKAAATKPSADVSAAIASAFFGAFAGALFGFFSKLVWEFLSGRWARGKLHRNACARLEHLCVNYLNEINVNLRLAGEARRAAGLTALRWQAPEPFQVDRSYGIDVLSLDLTARIAAVMTDMSRYNGDLRNIAAGHEGLQSALLAQQITPELWQQACADQERVWGVIQEKLQHLDDLVRDLKVRAQLFVQQYESPRARRHRRYGKILVWDLKKEDVDPERAAFESRWRNEIERHRAELSARGVVAAPLATPPPAPPGPSPAS